MSLYSWWASLGSPALPVTRNRRYAGDEAKGRCVEETPAWNLNGETPSCLDGAGMRACWRAGLHTLTAETGRGPEGSRLTVGNYRLRGCGVEKRLQSPGLPKIHQPEVCSSLNMSQDLKFYSIIFIFHVYSLYETIRWKRLNTWDAFMGTRFLKSFVTR